MANPPPPPQKKKKQQQNNQKQNKKETHTQKNKTKQKQQKKKKTRKIRKILCKDKVHIYIVAQATRCILCIKDICDPVYHKLHK